MKTKKFIYTVGISCSGKTTWVNEFLSQGNNNQSWVNINRDDIRGFLYTGGTIDWNKYKFTKEREKKVTEVQHMLIRQAVADGKNIILSDTNLNPKYIENFKGWDILKDYIFQPKVFEVDLLEALERDAKRFSGVGYKIITSQYEKFCEMHYSNYYHTFSDDKQDAVLVDIDGTIAMMDGRSPFEWGKVGEDLPRTEVIEMVKTFIHKGYTPIFMSGRDACCMKQTQVWLEKYFPELEGHFNLFMRPEGNFEKDSIVKKELFDKYVNHNYNVRIVFDDRPIVCTMWTYEKGLNVINVGKIHKEF